MAKIVVMGAGIGGISQVYELRKDHEIVLIGDSDRFEFTPSNRWVAVGWRKQKQITVAMRQTTRSVHKGVHHRREPFLQRSIAGQDHSPYAARNQRAIYSWSHELQPFGSTSG